MMRTSSLLISTLCLLIAICPAAAQTRPESTLPLKDWKGVLVDAELATGELLASYRADGYTAVTLALTASAGETAGRETEAARRIEQSGLELYYWIEVGRCPEFADEHPSWMASLQGHPEWRRLFPDVPEPQEGEVVKVYPWTPVLYQETWDAHQRRVARLLADRPQARGIFLNDLQAAPSACGCGNTLCRWTSDYGPVLTATRLGEDAAARFVAAVEKLAPDSIIVPVWTTECEEHDVDGPCAGVGCYEGTCWFAYCQQLLPLAEEASVIGVLLPYRDFERDLPAYEQPAGWVQHALQSFEVMPPQREGKAVDTSRLIAVLQGWDVTADQVTAQIARAQEAGAAGYLLARMKIDQSWTPKIIQTGK